MGFTIQISTELINRLTEDVEKKRTRRPKPKVPKPHQPELEVHEKKAYDTSESHKAPPPSAAPGWPPHPYLPLAPLPPQPANAELERIRSFLRESEKVVERLEKHEQDMLTEVREKAKELHEKEFKLPYQKPMPCLDEKDACLSCYKEHLKDPLKCADAVKKFEDCARRVRQQTQL